MKERRKSKEENYPTLSSVDQEVWGGGNNNNNIDTVSLKQSTQSRSRIQSEKDEKIVQKSYRVSQKLLMDDFEL